MEDNKKAKKAAEKKRKARRTLMIIILIVILAVFAFFAAMVISTKTSTSPVGYWVITEGTSGSVTMTKDDAEALGLNEVGSIRLDKSGTCEIVILDEEYTGNWESDEEGNITISYGEEKTLTATIDDEGKMTAQDELVEYTLEK